VISLSDFSSSVLLPELRDTDASLTSPLLVTWKTICGRQFTFIISPDVALTGGKTILGALHGM